MLRYFDAVFADRGKLTVAAPEASEAVDGRLVYFLGEPADAAKLTVVGGPKPVVVVTSDISGVVVDVAREVAATHEVLGSDSISGDRVARRELHEREASARRRLLAALRDAYRPGAPGVTWSLKGRIIRQSGRGLSSMLSTTCDSVYSASPHVRNEMLGRHELTSQGARARFDLLAAMLRSGDSERLGIDGYGPERAMYEAFLHHTGVHRKMPDGGWAFRPPRVNDPLRDSWDTVEETLDNAVEQQLGADTVYARLMAPPFGLKEGPIPVLLAAILLSRQEDVAIFQDGTYQPHLSADLLERLTKTPSRFSFRTFVASGARAQVIQLLADSLGLSEGRFRRSRNRLLLSVVSPLVGVAQSLPEYSLHTAAISSDAVAVRSALVEARDPDTLMFTALPTACGVRAFRVGERARLADVPIFVQRLTTALDELKAAFSRLCEDCAAMLAEQLSRSCSISELRAQLRARAQLIDSQVVERQLRSFLHLASDSGLDDDSWVEAMMLFLSGRPPSTWRDDDLARFEVKLAEAAGTLSRVEALHFEARQHSGSGFDARRIVVTAPDGTEVQSVVWIDHDVTDQLQAVASEAVERAMRVVGAHGPKALLALLAGELLDAAAAEPDAKSAARREVNQQT